MASRKRIVRISLLTLLGIILITLVFLPLAVKNYAIKHSKELLGRQIDIEKLKFNYFTGTLRIYGFKMFEQNEKDVFTSFDTLIVNTEPYKLINNTKSIEQFYLEGLNVNIIKKDLAYNFDDLIAFFMAKDSVPKDSLEATAFKYALSNLELKHASFNVYESNLDHTTTVEDLSFFIPFIGWDQENKSTADIKFNFKKGGYFESSFNVNPSNGEFDASVVVKDLYLDPFYKYAAQYALINTLEGRVSTKLKIEGNIYTPQTSLVSGNVSLNDFLMTDTTNKKILGSKQVTCDLEALDISKNSYKFESVTIDDPYAYFQLDSISNNLFRTFKYDPNEPSHEVTSDTISSNVYYAINHFKVNDGTLDYTDNLTGQPFDYHLSQIAINTNNIFSDSKWIDINSQMLLNNRGSLNAQIGFNPSDPLYTNLDLEVKNFLLSDLNIYSTYYTGHSVIQGDMFYYSHSTITNGDIVSENKLVIKDVSVNSNKKGLVTLPLKFVIYILKDKNGDIDLDVPVRGDLKNPEIDVWKIVWTTIKKLIFNTADNPVKSLAKLVDANPKDLENISFVYPDTIPGESQQKQLDLILKLEKMRPGLKIEMGYAADTLYLRELVLNQKIANLYTRKTKKTASNEKDIEAFVYSEIQSDTLKIADAKLLLIGGENSLDSLTHLYSKSLKTSVSRYIKDKEANSKIIVTDVKEAPGKKANEFLVNYSMKEEEASSSPEEQ